MAFHIKGESFEVAGERKTNKR